tara:strand:+ start:240 stop:776 length:537 start_codon:yes stop_codon:yes gene_type:complete
MTFDRSAPIYPKSYDYTVADTSTISGVSAFNIRNWMKRGVISIGKKSLNGRILFCPADLVALRVIGDLNKLLSVDPSASKSVAVYISDYFTKWMQRENKSLHVTEDGCRVETRLILRMDSSGDGVAVEQMGWGEAVFGFKIPERNSEESWARHPMLILPVEQIFFDVLNDLFELMEQE